jgi:membrane protein DedA with SNARE-associated domain
LSRLFLIFIENIFPPIPSEIILPFGGFATTLESSKVTVLGLIVFATLGSVLGAFMLYFVGRLLNVEKLEIFINVNVLKGEERMNLDYLQVSGLPASSSV